MSRNEIRLRKQKTTATGSERFRNFSVLQKRHEREQRMKRIIRVFTIIAAVLILIILIIAMQIIIEVRGNKKALYEPAKKESTEGKSISGMLQK